jgi:hypothetical protein
MDRYKIKLMLNDEFHLFANSKAEAEAEALDRIKAGAWPFDHDIKPQGFDVVWVERG